MEFDGHLVVNQVSFDLEREDYLCIVGENGSGKSTLIRCILGLIKPKTGTINFNGLKQTEIGYLPQQTRIQKDFPASVWEVVLSGCLNQVGLFPFYTKKEMDRAHENMALLGILEIKRKPYCNLSGGQQQRVLLARALCATQKILLLDEPTAGLDPMVTQDLYDLIKKLNKEQRLSIVMVSHDIEGAVKYGNKILHMQTTPIFLGSTEKYTTTQIYKTMTHGGNYA
jgi:zinc transport system ATP-binding protein